jgi:hypothetical protein
MTTEAQSLEVKRADPLSLLQLAIDRGCDPDRLDKLLALQERWERTRAEEAYNLAMNECQAEMPSIVKDRKNMHTSSTYATYESLNAAIRPIYTRHGFSLSFGEEPGTAKEGLIRVYADVMHRGGCTRRHRGDFALDLAGAKGTTNKTPIQATGSTLSYAKRYLCKGIFALAETDEDDDGQAAAAVITGDQIGELNDLIEKTGTDLGRFLSWANISSLDQMPLTSFAKAMDFLRRKAAKK